MLCVRCGRLRCGAVFREVNCSQAIIKTSLPLHSKHQEVIYAITLHKVVVIREHEPCAVGFLYHHVLVEAMIVALTVTIDNSEPGPSAHCFACVLEQPNWLRDFVIGLEQQDNVHTFSRQQW